jgi:hypothetical protein
LRRLNATELGIVGIQTGGRMGETYKRVVRAMPEEQAISKILWSLTE